MSQQGGENEWLQRLRDELPEAEADLIQIKERPEDAEPQDWHDLYWHAWDALRFDRHYGSMGGQMPIPYMAISSFARDRGLSGADFWTFHRLVTAIDAEWLDYVASERKKGGETK